MAEAQPPEGIYTPDFIYNQQCIPSNNIEPGPWQNKLHVTRKFSRNNTYWMIGISLKAKHRFVWKPSDGDGHFRQLRYRDTWAENPGFYLFRKIISPHQINIPFWRSAGRQRWQLERYFVFGWHPWEKENRRRSKR